MKLENVFTGVLVVAALAIAATAVHREFFAPQRRIVQAGALPSAKFDRDWKTYLPYGRRVSGDSTQVTVIEFSDFECPFCNRFHQSLQALERGRGSQEVSWSEVIIPFPLRNHKFARSMANASECAAERGRYREFVNAAFDTQDSLGLKSVGSFGLSAGITDTSAFVECSRAVTPTTLTSRVDSGVALGTRIGVHATPTVLVNGWRFESPPYDSLAAVIERIRTKGKP